MKKWLVVCAVLIVAFMAGKLLAEVWEYPLLEGENPYHRVIGPTLSSTHSLVSIYMENVYDPQRWKEWRFEVWVPANTADVLGMSVDYDNTPDHSNPLELFSVTLAPILDPPRWVGFKGFYADTLEVPWQDVGTTPVGSGDLHPWGNPMWVSYHFEVDEAADLFGFYIDDQCIPEPMTVCLMGLGFLSLLGRRRVV